MRNINNDELFESLDAAIIEGNKNKIQELIEQSQKRFYPYGLDEKWEPNPLLDWSKNDREIYHKEHK